MKNITKINVAIIITILAVGAVNAQELDFTGWDSTALSMDGGSQTFSDICGSIDVTVTANGEFDAPSQYAATMDGSVISSEHAPSSMTEEHSFTFSFSSPFDVIVEVLSLDRSEEYEVSSQGAETYSNIVGMAPVVSTVGSGLLLDGTGFGQGPNGAAIGQVAVDAPESGPFSVTVTYRADATSSNITKYGSFRLLKAPSVPEPQSAALFGIGLLGMCGRIRRRR